jgi:hypothetical protein
VQREHVGVFLAVAIKGKGVSAIIIPNAENLTVTEIANYQKEKLEKINKNDHGSYNIFNSIGKIPWPFRGFVVKFLKWWIMDQGLRFPFMKIHKSPFGSIALSNIGTFGLPIGYLALWPIANLPAVIAMGKIKDKPVVINGEITIRSIIPISGTFDHRIVEADKIGIFKDGVEHRLLNPEILDKKETK